MFGSRDHVSRRDFVTTSGAIVGRLAAAGGTVWRRAGADDRVDRSCVVPRGVLGRTKANVSRLGIGCAHFKRKHVGPRDVREVLHAALDLGVNYLDVAPSYGNEKIGFVFQDHYLLPQLSVLENVLVPTLARAATGDEQIERAHKLLARVGLAERLEHRPAELSGGECRRIGVAMIDLISPKLLLADEPVTALDYINKWEILSLFEKLNKEKNVAFLIATHDLEAMVEVVERVVVLYGGVIIEEFPIKRFWEVCHPHTVELVRYYGFLKNKLTADVLTSYNTGAKVLSIENTGTGCVFIDNCRRYQLLGKQDECLAKQPSLLTVEYDHKSACYFYNKAVE